MAVSVAAAYVNNDGGASVTSGAFDVATDDLIVVVGNSDELGEGAITWTISDNQTPDLTYTEIARRGNLDGTDNGAVIAWYHKVVSPITGLTITLAVSGNASDSPAIKVYKLASGDYDATTIVGAQTEATFSSANLTSAGITAETAGTGILVGTDWQQLGVPASSDLTFTGFDTAGDISGGSGFKTLTSGASNTANFNPAGAGTGTGNYLWFEIRAGAGGGAITGDVPLTLSVTSSLTGAGALAGSVALSITPTGALTGAGALAGSIPLPLDATGALTGAGALLGSVDLTVTPSGVLTGAGALAGDIALALAVAGDLTSQDAGAITGSVPLTLAVTGTLTGTGALRGMVPLDLSVTGTFVPAASETFSGGFAIAFEREMERRKRERKERQELEEESERIEEETTRQIAQLLREQEAKDARRAELARLSDLVARTATERDEAALSPRVQKAIRTVAAKQTAWALFQLEREMHRAQEEEQFLLHALSTAIHLYE